MPNIFTDSLKSLNNRCQYLTNCDPLDFWHVAKNISSIFFLPLPVQSRWYLFHFRLKLSFLLWLLIKIWHWAILGFFHLALHMTYLCLLLEFFKIVFSVSFSCDSFTTYGPDSLLMSFENHTSMLMPCLVFCLSAFTFLSYWRYSDTHPFQKMLSL